MLETLLLLHDDRLPQSLSEMRSRLEWIRPSSVLEGMGAQSVLHDGSSLSHLFSGLVPGKDAPDITTNTFLAEITPEQLEAVAKGFLMHCECKLYSESSCNVGLIFLIVHSAIFGHLAWTSQHASGNCGDDLRALKLAELQPWTMTHPNQETDMVSRLWEKRVSIDQLPSGP